MAIDFLDSLQFLVLLAMKTNGEVDLGIFVKPSTQNPPTSPVWIDELDGPRPDYFEIQRYGIYVKVLESLEKKGNVFRGRKAKYLLANI